MQIYGNFEGVPLLIVHCLGLLVMYNDPCIIPSFHRFTKGTVRTFFRGLSYKLSYE